MQFGTLRSLLWIRIISFCSAKTLFYHVSLSDDASAIRLVALHVFAKRSHRRSPGPQQWTSPWSDIVAAKEPEAMRHCVLIGFDGG